MITVFTRLLFLISLLLPAQAYSAIISINDSVFGIDSVTRDTVSGLDWLDVTLSVNRSYGDVSSQFGVGGDFKGWRYATISDFDNLLSGLSLDISNLKGPQGQTWNNTVDVSTAKRIVSLLGWTYVNNLPSTGNPFGQKELYGVFGDHYADIFSPDGQSPPSHVYGKIGASDTLAYSNTSGQILHNSSDNLVGSFLVQSVPEPSILALFTAGLAGLGFARKRKQKSN